MSDQTFTPSRLAYLIQCIEDNTKCDNPASLLELEALQPTSVQDWATIDNFYKMRRLNLWREIFVERFLLHCPSAVPALIVRLELMAARELRGKEWEERAARVKWEVGKLLPRVGADAGNLTKLAHVLVAVFDREGAIALFEAVLKTNVRSVEVWQDLVGAEIGLKKLGNARESIKKMYKAVEPTFSNYLIIAELVARIDERRLFSRVARHALELNETPSSWELVRLARLTDKLNDKAILGEVLSRIDWDNLDHPWLTQTLSEIKRLNGIGSVWPGMP